MKPHFHYCSIGDGSALRLRDLLSRGQSVVVIGPPGVGKRYLLEYVNDIRTKCGKEKFLIAGFGRSEVVCSEKAVAQTLAASSRVEPVDSIERWADSVRSRRTPSNPLCLFMTNLDAMSKVLAYRVLTCVQSLVKSRLMVTAVTGEGNLIDLVDGSPTSAWSCADQFVVHAHDHRHFHRFLTKRLRQANLQLPERLSEAKEVVRELYSRTGGNVSLLRAVVWEIGDGLNYHFKRPAKRSPARLRKDAIPKTLKETHIIPVAGVNPFSYGFNCLLSAAKETGQPNARGASAELVPSIHDLERMLWRDEPVEVEAKPHLLELAGLAKRENTSLTWFSPYSKSFVEEFLSKRDVADLYAFAHEWEDAYRLYEEVPFEEKWRPLSDSDHVSLIRLVDGVAIHFHRIISETTQSADEDGIQSSFDKLRSELRRALQHLTGIPDERITCWVLDWLGNWICIGSGNGITQFPSTVKSAWSVLVATSGDRLREEDLHGSREGYHWVVNRDHENRPLTAILVDCTNDPLQSHPMRNHAIYRILRGYRRAQERNLMAERMLRERAEHRILERIWMLTKEAAWDVRSVLDAIAPPLRGALSSISRIIYLAYAHPDPTNPGYVPLYDTADPQAPVHDNSAFVLPPSFLSRDFRSKGISLPVEVANRCAKPSRVVPFQRDVACVKLPYVKGLLVIEPHKNRVLSEADFRFVKNLAERGKPIWELGMRLGLLHESIEANQLPSILLDRNRRILFCNTQACEMLDLKTVRRGWQAEPTPIDSLPLSEEVVEALTPSRQKESSEFLDLTKQMRGAWLRECHPLVAPEQEPRGWVLTFRDRVFLNSSFQLIRELEAMNNSEDALALIMKSLKKWLRLEDTKLRFYLIDPEDPKQLVSKASMGFVREQHTVCFKEGGICWVDGVDTDAWTCIHRREPLAFRLLEGAEFGRERRTARGLKYTIIGWHQHFEKLERDLGDLSIDFPLLSEKSTLGKLTINFKDTDVDSLPAELPMQLGALSVVLGGLLGRVNQEEIRQKLILANATEQAQRTTAHNLLSQISPFAAFIARYRLCEPSLPKLKAINDDLEEFHEHARKSVRRIKDRIGFVRLSRTQNDLVQVIEKALRTVVYEEGEWRWDDPPQPAVGLWDTSHLGNVFIELAHNSREFTKPGVALRIRLSLQFSHREGESCVKLRYSDNGHGVAQDLKSRIFDGRSFRTEIQRQGRGLGLAYVLRVIEAHGGLIQEVGTEGQGATFEIQLPIRDTLHKASNPPQSL